MRRVVSIAAGAALACEVVNVAPAVTALARVRRMLFRQLCGYGEPSTVALTFDDGPDPASTPRFLDELDDLDAKATFFVLGSMAQQAPHLTREIVDRGHEVAVHGHRHRTHVLRTPADVRRDVGLAKEIVEYQTGRPVRWFRPPNGLLSVGSLNAARELDLVPVLWTTWGRDWTAHATPASVSDRILDGLAPGATVLLHDSDCTSAPGAWRAALGALPIVGSELKRRGLAAVTLSDHLASRNPDFAVSGTGSRRHACRERG